MGELFIVPKFDAEGKKTHVEPGCWPLEHNFQLGAIDPFSKPLLESHVSIVELLRRTGRTIVGTETVSEQEDRQVSVREKEARLQALYETEFLSINSRYDVDVANLEKELHEHLRRVSDLLGDSTCVADLSDMFCCNLTEDGVCNNQKRHSSLAKFRSPRLQVDSEVRQPCGVVLEASCTKRAMRHLKCICPERHCFVKGRCVGNAAYFTDYFKTKIKQVEKERRIDIQIAVDTHAARLRSFRRALPEGKPDQTRNWGWACTGSTPAKIM